ncbi:MAG: hypothetical protein BWX71_02791 [Deltaproteobacteria bacterium ADurb.Bin072]|nr:MAG: hypothetical protein BWX71_02791 [Deltaproteobacteria bacterium ADurb.Bin072]
MLRWMVPFRMIRSWMRYTMDAMAATTKNASPAMTLRVCSTCQVLWGLLRTSVPACRVGAMNASTMEAAGRKKAARMAVFLLRTKGMNASDEKRTSMLRDSMGVSTGSWPDAHQREMNDTAWAATLRP